MFPFRVSTCNSRLNSVFISLFTVYYLFTSVMSRSEQKQVAFTECSVLQHTESALKSMWTELHRWLLTSSWTNFVHQTTDHVSTESGV